MPHRIAPFLTSHLVNVIEGAFLCVLAVFNGARMVLASIPENDWSKISGPNGVAFVAVIAVIVLWGTFLRFQFLARKDAKEREIKEDARHTETIRFHRENTDRLLGITVESIKSQGIATMAVKAMDSNIQRLTVEMMERPCMAGMQKKHRQIPEFPEMPSIANQPA